MSISYLYVHFQELSIQGLCPFFNWVVCFPGVGFCKSFVKYGCIYPNYQMYLLVNMFSHSVGCLFILLMVFFAVQKLFSLMQSHLFIFSFVSLA